MVNRVLKDHLKPPLFRFEDWWAQYKECRGVVEEAWIMTVLGYPMLIMTEKIKATRVALLKWQHQTLNLGMVILNMPAPDSGSSLLYLPAPNSGSSLL